ncbi:hypothetical protein LZ31DRAFT_556226 [Colletotrichum somersetense]|nr:hypothetical protein LZ31DRAFT_556226 [Colletotrichum somersetense]
MTTRRRDKQATRKHGVKNENDARNARLVADGAYRIAICTQAPTYCPRDLALIDTVVAACLPWYGYISVVYVNAWNGTDW